MGFTLCEKTVRVVRFLVALRNPKIATALSEFGFGAAEAEEGWTLIRNLGAHTWCAAPRAARQTDSLRELNAWATKWFRVTSAVLEGRYPQVLAALFRGQAQQLGGNSTLLAVHLFLDRYEALGQAAGGEEELAAKRLLEARGLTASVVEEARAMVTSLTYFRESDLSQQHSEQQQSEELRLAERALWIWYLEWSQVARIAIKGRALLKQLGVLNAQRGSAAEDSAAVGD